MHSGAWLAALVLAAPPALAGDGIYRWTDDQGEVHYTNDLETPPGDKTLEPVSGDEVSVVPSQAKAPQAKPTREELELRLLETQVKKAEADLDRGKGRDAAEQEETWRAAFRLARRKVELLRDELAEQQTVLTVSGFPVTARMYGTGGFCGRRAMPCQTGAAEEFELAKLRVKQLERDIAAAEEELADLDRRASYAEVPQEWRR